MSFHFVMIGRIIKNDYWTLLIPVFAFAMLMSFGVWGIFSISQSITDQKRADALFSATQKLNALKANIETTVAPCMTMNAIIQLYPDWDFIKTAFDQLAPLLIAQVFQSAVLTFVLAPNAIAQSIYPANLTAWQRVYGLDLLKETVWRPDALKTVALRREMVMTGPVRLRAGMIGLVSRFSVWVSNANANDTFGSPSNPHDCDVCYDGEKRERFWGFAQMNIDWEYLTRNVTKLYDLCQNGLNFDLLYKDPVSQNVTNVATCDRGMRSPLSIEFPIMHNRWTMHVESANGWRPGWFVGVLIVVVLFNLMLTSILFALLVKRRQHIWLLESVLPSKVLTHIQRGEEYAEYFRNCTVLFSDIVSYTTIASSMNPLEVAGLLNEIYTLYDGLVDKHRCHKVETIGDAFMAVSGIENESAQVSAVQIAKLAFDMLKVTEGFVSKHGLQIQIRVGIHSGDLVGAVVGFKMPHFCLCGDTVNTASRMESNSLPMKIHVSDYTAQLIQASGSKSMTLVDRGEINIKGKGVMRTFWLEKSQSSEPTTPHKIRSHVDLRIFQIGS
jgi:class 3 adenylate cyclase/sensor domain CHASE-containing protein